MAESRAKRMRVVLTLAQQQEDSAAQQLGQFRAQLEQEQQQLQQLHQYTAQYMEDYSSRREGVYAYQMINYSGFIHRLEELCLEQESKLVRIKAGLEKQQQIWRTFHQKRKSIEELIERLKKEESALLDKRLQKMLDELSILAHQRRESE